MKHAKRFLIKKKDILLPKFFKPDGPGFGFKSYSRSSNLSGALMNT